MDELKVEIALEIIQRKIVSLLKSNKDIDVDTAKETLKTLVEEREKIYNLDEESIRIYKGTLFEGLKLEKERRISEKSNKILKKSLIK